MTTGNTRHFFAGGNTARGFASQLTSVLQDTEHIFVLEGYPGIGKMTHIEQIGDRLVEEGYEVHVLHCASDPDSAEGIAVPRLKLAIVDGTAPHDIAAGLSGHKVRRINLNAACDPDLPARQQAEIAQLNGEIAAAFERAYSGFAEALRVHDDWERIYIANMDFGKADARSAEYAHLLFGDRKLEKNGIVEHRFLGAATPQGAVDFVPNLTEGLKRYLIKGRPGSGKSTLLKKIAATAAERGLDAEIYHCGFDPGSLDMIIVREAGFAIFDSTAPHEYFPDRPSDEILDMYALCIRPGTDEDHAEQIRPVKEQYAAAMKRSIEHLARARSLLDQLERIYAQSADLAKLAQIGSSLREEVARVQRSAEFV